MSLSVVGERTRQQLVEVLRKPTVRPIAGIGSHDPATVTQVLQITSGAANAFGKPARIQKWHSGTGDLSDLSATDVRVIDHNGRELAEGDYVNARFLGFNDDAVGCYSAVPASLSPPFAVVSQGGGASGFSLAFGGMVGGYPTNALNTGVEFTLTETGLYEISGTVGTVRIIRGDSLLGPAVGQENMVRVGWDVTAGSGAVYHTLEVLMYLGSDMESDDTYYYGACEVHAYVSVITAPVTVELILHCGHSDHTNTTSTATFNPLNTNLNALKLTGPTTFVSSGVTVGSSVVTGGTGGILMNVAGVLQEVTAISGGTF